MSLRQEAKRRKASGMRNDPTMFDLVWKAKLKAIEGRSMERRIDKSRVSQSLDSDGALGIEQGVTDGRDRLIDPCPVCDAELEFYHAGPVPQ